MKYDEILLAHGSGGAMTNELIAKEFMPHFTNPLLDELDDGAVFETEGSKLCFSTDSYVVNPVFFPGGNIGSLAVHGTVNDVSMCGGKPLMLSAGFIIEEGFPVEDLRTIIASMGDAAKEAGVFIATGDTKVVPKGAADKIFINTSGVGIIEYEKTLSARSIRPGDCVIVNGTIGDHGAAILGRREGLEFDSEILSDSAPLNTLVKDILDASPDIHCMRDATRGGLGAILAEIAEKAGVAISLEEDDVPVKDSVRGVCEILGLDPVYIANEGKMVVFCPESEAPAVLAAMKANPYGRDAAVIGRVEESDRSHVVMNTVIGGQREIDLPAGEIVPRIC